METVQCIGERASVRVYSSQPVTRDMLEALVDAGRRAPTARAVEPWEFVVVTDKGKLEMIGGLTDHGAFLKNAAACIAVLSQDTKYYLEDGCAATENILLAAADKGLGACWIAGDKKPYAEQVLQALGAPCGLKLVSLIALGWPVKKPLQRKSRQLQEVIHWEKF